MDRDLLKHLPVVLSVAQHLSFASAAAALGMSPSAVSHAVGVVEQKLGEPLFHRTTRSVSITEAGNTLLATLAPAVADIAKTIETLASNRGEVTGRLRVNGPRVAMTMALADVVAKLASLHPKLTIELHSNDAFVDIVADGFDVGVRLGSAIAQDMIACRLTPKFKAVVVASPSYLRKNGTPHSIRELSKHNCIGFRLLATGGTYNWELLDNKKIVETRPIGTSIVTDPTYVRDLTMAGVGIGYIYEPLVRNDIRLGKLKWLLPDSAIEEDGFFIYFPRRGSFAPKLRAFVDTVRMISKAKIV